MWAFWLAMIGLYQWREQRRAADALEAIEARLSEPGRDCAPIGRIEPPINLAGDDDAAAFERAMDDYQRAAAAFDEAMRRHAREPIDIEAIEAPLPLPPPPRRSFWRWLAA